MFNSSNPISLSGFDINSVPTGKLTYYALEGDVSGSTAESIVVEGSSGATLTPSDGINPANNPVNGTINTSTPGQTGLTGIDIDQYDISSVLAFADTDLDVTYTAGTDKWWVGVNVLGLNASQEIPEPGTLPLLSIGLAGMGLARRRRKV